MNSSAIAASVATGAVPDSARKAIARFELERAAYEARRLATSLRQSVLSAFDRGVDAVALADEIEDVVAATSRAIASVVLLS